MININTLRSVLVDQGYAIPSDTLHAAVRLATANPGKRPLTPRQLKVYYVIKRLMQGDYSPTVREICASSGYKSPGSMSRMLNEIEDRGWIKRGNGRHRGIVLL